MPYWRLPIGGYMDFKRSPALPLLLERRLNRRRLLAGGAELAVLGVAARGARAQTGAAGGLTFPRVAPSSADAVIVPDGYRSDVVVRWGDPLFDGAAALDARSVVSGALATAEAAAAQEKQFGYNCDGIGLFPLAADRQLLCVNHEFPLPALMFPGWAEAREARTVGAFVREHPAVVAYMQAAVGLSVVELRRGARWDYVRDSRYNRRVTAHTPMEITGPARNHALLNPRRERVALAYGTLGNCAAGTTPWRTYVTAEENVDDYFGNGAAAELDAATELAHRRFGFRLRDSAYRWEYVDPRFDAAMNPAESLKFGWIVELDPFDPQSRPKKRTALGRFKHECATTVLAADGRAVVYMGDDQQFEYFYKFVSRAKVDAARPERNRDLLDDGTLYVARLDDDGHGEWLPLVHGVHPELTPERGFASQADVVLRCREAADRLGATPLDRPEDVAVSPLTGNVYVACTQNLGRDEGVVEVGGRMLDTRTDRASPRAPNTAGHILELAEQGGDAAATSFRWEIFLLAGAPSTPQLVAALPPEHSGSLAAELTYFGGATDSDELSAFANPDNLGFDADGNLWIVTDGNQPGNFNDGCFACATDGSDRGRVRQFMSGPVGAEVCGCEFTQDGGTLFLTLEHPGEAGTATSPQSHWPDGGDAAPRPSVVAIEPEARGRKFGS
jgi:secreted PhoX family phosphatase